MIGARHLTLALISAFALGGCGVFGGGSDTAEPPAELVPLENQLDVDELWSHRVGRGTERLRLGLQPATDGTNVFAGGHDGTVTALDPETGRVLWSVGTELPLSAGPAYGGGRLSFGTSDGDLLALDAASGELLWRVPVGSVVLAPPAMNENVVVFRSLDGRLRAVSADNGSNRWTIEQTVPALTLRGNTAPIIAGSRVVAGFNNGRIGAYSLTNGEPAWEMAIASPTGRNELERLVDVGMYGLAVVGNDVFAAGYQGQAVGVDLNTGLVIWQQDVSSYSGISADAADVYVTTDVDAVLALSRGSGATRWRQEALRLRDLTPPTPYGETVVVGDFEGYVHWLARDDGRLLARESAAGGRISAPPLVVGEHLVVQADDGRVSALTIVEEEDEDEAEEDDSDADADADADEAEEGEG